MPELVQAGFYSESLVGVLEHPVQEQSTELCPVEQTWQGRETERFRTGYYSPVPELAEFEKYGVAFDREHYIHLSVKGEAEMIAFTASANKGKANRQTPMKFGRYLKAHCEHLTDGQIRECVIALRIAVGLEVSPAGPAIVKFARDCETINRIFETEMSPCNSNHTSCMYGKFTAWDDRPYHVYANSPDVAVAYWERDGGIIARSVVSTKANIWVRVYTPSGDETVCTAFIQMLEALGYNEGELVGSRLSKLPPRGSRNLMPYVDNGGQRIKDDGDYWLVVESGECGAFAADQTDGFACEEPLCDRCECHENECECSYCTCCEESVRGGCDECNFCEQCDLCTRHGLCSCTRCDHCDNIINPSSRYISACECERCSDCGERSDDCDCEPEEEKENLLPATEETVLC